MKIFILTTLIFFTQIAVSCEKPDINLAFLAQRNSFFVEHINNPEYSRSYEAPLTKTNEEGDIQWVAVGRSIPSSGLLAVYDCKGNLLASIADGKEQEISPEAITGLDSSKGNAITTTEISYGAGEVYRFKRIYAYEKNAIKLKFSHTLDSVSNNESSVENVELSKITEYKFSEPIYYGNSILITGVSYIQDGNGNVVGNKMQLENEKYCYMEKIGEYNKCKSN